VYDEENDVYNQVYQQNKLTVNEIRQFQQFKNLTEEEIEILSDLIFEMAIVAIRNID